VVGKSLGSKDRGTAGFLAGILLTMALGSGIVFASRVGAQTTVIPSVSLSERYDSNVWYAPRGSIPPGKKAWDYVTTATAMVDVVDTSRLADSILRAGVDGNAFVYNSDLAFYSTTVNASSDMTRGVSELVRGLRLRISDSFRYTPEPPAFLTGGQPAGTSPSDIYTRGIQGYRANTFNNVLQVKSDYTLYRSFSLSTNYSYSMFRTGAIDATVTSTVPVSYFNNKQHSADIGPTFTFDGGDTLFFKYNYTIGESKPEGPGATTNYVFQTIAPEYVTKAVVPGWTLTISGGATLVEQSAGSRVFMSGGLGLATDYDRRTHVEMSVSRQSVPSYFGQTSAAMITNVARFYVSYSLSRLLRLRAGANYAYGETAPVKTSAYRTVYGSVALEYSLTQSTIMSLSQEYTYYEYTGALPFDRSATMLALKTVWN
jgi:hypothetical protein